MTAVGDEEGMRAPDVGRPGRGRSPRGAPAQNRGGTVGQRRAVPALLVGLGLVAGCTPADYGPPVTPAFRPAAAELTPDDVLPVAVRTFRGRPQSAGGEEITGATCTIASPLYTLELKTPARAALPSYGPRTPPVRVTCEWEGQAAAIDAQPFNLDRRSQRVRDAVLAGGLAGAVGGVAVVGTAGSVPDEGATFTYDPIEVSFPN